MEKTRRLIIVGDSAFAEIAYEYFTYDSDYEVVAFSVETPYLKRESLFGLPVVPFESLEQSFDPQEHEVYAASVYTQLNRLRTRLSAEAKAKGFKLASYISSRAFVWRNVRIGEHCFIFEDNTVQPFVRLGNNVVLWSGNHIGHHSVIKDNCFVSSHVVVSGFVEVEENCFLGVNSTIVNNVKIGKDCWLGPNVTIVKDAPEASFFKPGKNEISSTSTLEYFKVRV
ncbi:MAG TPA: acetyltransferase [Pyrinomonadaceae bacterium]|jgi:sugar O-acyltransferase (sialic acid O-acetyltransferase NeuD family)